MSVRSLSAKITKGLAGDVIDTFATQPALLMTSLILTAGYNMAALTVVSFALSNVDYILYNYIFFNKHDVTQAKNCRNAYL